MEALNTGPSREDLAATWFDETLSVRIRKRYSQHLGGSWDTTNARTIVGRWAKATRDLRNRVVHRGHRPNEQEVIQAQDAMKELENYIKLRVVTKRNVFPRTTLLLLGTPGLEKRGVLGGKIARFIHEIAPNEPSWFESYSTWLAAFEASRARF